MAQSVHPGLSPDVLSPDVRLLVAAPAMSHALPPIRHGLPGRAPWASPKRTPAVLPRWSHLDHVGARWCARPSGPTTATLLPATRSSARMKHQKRAGRIASNATHPPSAPRWCSRPISPVALLPSTCSPAQSMDVPRTARIDRTARVPGIAGRRVASGPGSPAALLPCKVFLEALLPAWTWTRWQQGRGNHGSPGHGPW